MFGIEWFKKVKNNIDVSLDKDGLLVAVSGRWCFINTTGLSFKTKENWLLRLHRNKGTSNQDAVLMFATTEDVLGGVCIDVRVKKLGIYFELLDLLEEEKEIVRAYGFAKTEKARLGYYLGDVVDIEYADEKGLAFWKPH